MLDSDLSHVASSESSDLDDSSNMRQVGQQVATVVGYPVSPENLS